MYRNFVTKVMFASIFVVLTIFLFRAREAKIDKVSDKNTGYSQERMVSANTKVEDFEKYIMLFVNLEKYSFTAIPNFDKSIPSDSVIEKFSCKVLINGAMYDKFGGPLGLYYLDGILLGELNKSMVMNGIVSFTDTSAFKIDLAENFDVQKGYKFYMQTGPILIKDGVKEILHNNNYARRIMLGKDSQGEIYALAAFDKENYTDGPSLSETADMIVSLKDRTGIEFEDVVNLDGGNASLFITAFKNTPGLKPGDELNSDMSSSFGGISTLKSGEGVITNDYSIKESTFAGSYLCFK